MFSDAFGEENLFSDKRHVPAGRASVYELSEKFPLWKSNKKVLQCQRNSRIVNSNLWNNCAGGEQLSKISLA